ncbi:hypothetical protein TNCV_3890571, partial [Trichonephila clavipes]
KVHKMVEKVKVLGNSLVKSQSSLRHLISQSVISGLVPQGQWLNKHTVEEAQDHATIEEVVRSSSEVVF